MRWHYICGGRRRRSGLVDLAHGGRQRDTGGGERETGGGTRWRAQQEAFVVLLDLGLGERVEIGENVRPGAVATKVGELPPHMAPAESKRDVTALSELRIGAIAIDLQNAAESREMLGRPRMLAVGGVHIGNARRSAAGPGPLVARIGPQLALLDTPASGIEHRCRRLVGEQLGRLL